MLLCLTLRLTTRTHKKEEGIQPALMEDILELSWFPEISTSSFIKEDEFAIEKGGWPLQQRAHVVKRV